MSLLRVIFSFPFYLMRMGCRRVFLKYVVYDVSPISVYLLVGTVSLVFSLTFGGTSWMESIRTGTPAPTGTVALCLLTFLIGFSLLLQAMTLDISNSPRPSHAARHVPLEDVALWFADATERQGATVDAHATPPVGLMAAASREV